MYSPRLGCSSISFRHQVLADALATMASLGFREIDLGALPGVCDHVPYELTPGAVREIAATIADSGLRVRSVNGDIGDLNVDPGAVGAQARAVHLERLLELASAVGAEALVLPCGALERTPVATLADDVGRVADRLAAARLSAGAFGLELWTESLHYFRLCHDIERAQLLTDRLDGSDVGVVMDFSHIVASGADPGDFVRRFGPSIRHVHLRDAVPGNINLSLGRGDVDFAAGFAALQQEGYAGHFSLELETRDVTHEQRPRVTRDSARWATDLLHAAAA